MIVMRIPIEYKAAKVYTLQKNLKVRSGPSTAYAQKYYKELSPDLKKKAYDQLFAVLKAGSKIVAIKVITNKNEVWLKIPVGYILAKNEKEIYIK